MAAATARIRDTGQATSINERPHMSDLQEMTRVLYGHRWTSARQWASNLDRLADLTDDEIDELGRLGAEELTDGGIAWTF